MFGYPGIDLQDKCRILLDKYNLKMLILTCGINGSYVFTPGNVSFQPLPKVEVADTVGAGDSFTAAFIAAFCAAKVSLRHNLPPYAHLHMSALRKAQYPFCLTNTPNNQ